MLGILQVQTNAQECPTGPANTSVMESVKVSCSDLAAFCYFLLESFCFPGTGLFSALRWVFQLSGKPFYNLRFVAAVPESAYTMHCLNWVSLKYPSLPLHGLREEGSSERHG